MAKEAEVKLDEDPRSVRDPVMYNRFRVMIEEEAIKPTWGCPLYIAARRGGWLSEDQKRAGDKYQQITFDYIQAQSSDPDELPSEMRELAYKRVNRRKRLWKEAVKILGIGRSVVDSLIIREERLISERERILARDALTRLSVYFNVGTKGERA